MIVLDMHVLVWYLDSPEKLSRPAEEAVSAALHGDGAAISDISLWEIAMLVQKGRLQFARDVKEWLADLSAVPNLCRYRISSAVATLSTRLPGRFGGDPADRLIVATALNLGAVVTRVRLIGSYSRVSTVW